MSFKKGDKAIYSPQGILNTYRGTICKLTKDPHPAYDGDGFIVSVVWLKDGEMGAVYTRNIKHLSAEKAVLHTCLQRARDYETRT